MTDWVYFNMWPRKNFFLSFNIWLSLQSKSRCLWKREKTFSQHMFCCFSSSKFHLFLILRLLYYRFTARLLLALWKQIYSLLSSIARVLFKCVKSGFIEGVQNKNDLFCPSLFRCCWCHYWKISTL